MIGTFFITNFTAVVTSTTYAFKNPFLRIGTIPVFEAGEEEFLQKQVITQLPVTDTTVIWDQYLVYDRHNYLFILPECERRNLCTKPDSLCL